jgi:glycosyltransferase involved in cell wall biosynthesis
VPASKDTADYGHLYRRCLELEGVEYVGSLAQPQLAQALREVTLLAYPNHFPETSCIAVLEALAAGLRVVTSRLGALPETLGGCGSLIDVNGNWPAYRERFAAAVVRVLTEIAASPPNAEEHLTRQLDYVRSCGNWADRAREWEAWLRTL